MKTNRKKVVTHVESHFFNRTDLRRHIEMVHEGRKDYKCENCEKLFSTADNLKKHFRSVIHVENHFQWLDY